MLRRLDELRTAIGFFSRLPALSGGYWSFGKQGKTLSADQHSALYQDSFWAAPLAGLILHILALCLALVAKGMGLVALAPIIYLACLAASTGGLHDDGLADLADASGGGSTARRLDIMKDSRVGSFGVITLVLWYAAAFVCLDQIFAQDSLGHIVAITLGAGMLSRGLLPLAIKTLPNARSDGLGQGAKGLSWLVVGAAGALGIVPVLLCGLWLEALVVIIAQVGVYALAWRLIGGTNGDVFGAAQKMGELGLYIGAIAVMTGGN